MNCRDHCGACCVAPSISSPIPGMPNGKPAGIACIQLDELFRCKIFGSPERPKVCSDFQAVEYICGSHRDHALMTLHDLESDTAPELTIKDIT